MRANNSFDHADYFNCSRILTRQEAFLDMRLQGNIPVLRAAAAGAPEPLL
jgi:hypothetical protein